MKDIEYLNKGRYNFAAEVSLSLCTQRQEEKLLPLPKAFPVEPNALPCCCWFAD